ncbi:MAG: DUF6448 family protein [Bacteroidota bacterium]
MKKHLLYFFSTLLVLVSTTHISLAHCDTMDGPVVKAAKVALEKGDVTPVLRWIKKEYEDEVRSAFKRTLEVRTKGKEARELADMYFFETLVRLHRAGEGEPYTGLKPAGTPVEPPVAMADKALETGDMKELSTLLTMTMEEGLAVRFKHAREAKKEADKNVEAGREFVEAYVNFVHYAEQLHQIAESSAHHDENEEKHEIH